MSDDNTLENTDTGAANEKKAQNLATLTMIFRGMGTLFMLGGAALAANLGGAAHALGLGDLSRLIGGILFVLGCVDFFVLPLIFAKALNKPKNTM